jgi:hypothetical protein
MSFLGARRQERGGFDGSSVGIVVAILVMFERSGAGISTLSAALEETHSDIGNRVNDQPVVSSLLDCLRNE